MIDVEIFNNPSLIDWGNPIVLDFETYYDKQYSLSKVTTERYIRGEEFETIGLSIKYSNQKCQFYRREDGIAVLKDLLEKYPYSPVVGHNLMFDAAILAFRYNIHPRFLVDTSILARISGLDRIVGGASLAKLSTFLYDNGLAAQHKGTYVANMLGVHASDMSETDWHEYGEYCKLDSILEYALYMYLVDKVPVDEFLAIDMTLRMYTKPRFVLNKPLLEAYADKLESERTGMLAALAEKLGFADIEALHKTLRSSKKFTLLLESLGVEVPMKYSEKKQCLIPAVSKTDTAFLDLLNHEDEIVRSVVETRLDSNSSMEQTRTASFIDVATRGDMPVPLRYASAHTGRYGGCFTADTKVLCFTAEQHIVEKDIVDVLLSDLVWDGIEWCEHEGVAFNGYQEVITYDGLTGTKNHRVFVDENTETTLFEAMRTGTPIMDCPTPENWKRNPAKVGAR